MQSLWDEMLDGRGQTTQIERWDGPHEDEERGVEAGEEGGD
jgi:hypothetical protein